MRYMPSSSFLLHAAVFNAWYQLCTANFCHLCLVPPLHSKLPTSMPVPALYCILHSSTPASNFVLQNAAIYAWYQLCTAKSCSLCLVPALYCKLLSSTPCFSFCSANCYHASLVPLFFCKMLSSMLIPGLSCTLLSSMLGTRFVLQTADILDLRCMPNSSPVKTAMVYACYKHCTGHTAEIHA